MSCSTALSTPINDGCPSPVKQFEMTGWIAVYANIATKTFSKTTSLATDIVMASTTKFYPVTIRGKQPFKDTKIEAAEKPYGWIFNKTTKFTILGNTPATAQQAQALSNNKSVLILNQSGVTDNSAFPIFGLEVGLNMSAATLDQYADAGGWDITLMEENADTAGLFFWKTDYATTKAAIASLIA